MIFAYYAAAAVQARQQRAVELSACDLAGDEEYPLQGERGGRYKLVGNRKVYKPGGGGGGAKPAPGGKKAASQKKGSGKQDRAVVTPRVGKALEQLKDLYAVVHEETTGYGAIDEMVDALGRLSRDEVAQVAKGFNLAFRKGASKNALVGEIKRKLTEQKAIAQRIAPISAHESTSANERSEEEMLARVDHLRQQRRGGKPLDEKEVDGLVDEMKSMSPAFVQKIFQSFGHRSRAGVSKKMMLDIIRDTLLYAPS